MRFAVTFIFYTPIYSNLLRLAPISSDLVRFSRPGRLFNSWSFGPWQPLFAFRQSFSLRPLRLCAISFSVRRKNKVRAETRRAQRRGRVIKTFLYCHHSCRDYVTTREKQKAYGRFSGTIFLGAFQNPQEAVGQGPANEKSRQNVKKSKVKCFFFRPKPPSSCQKAPKEALFCCQYVFTRGPLAG